MKYIHEKNKCAKSAMTTENKLQIDKHTWWEHQENSSVGMGIKRSATTCISCCEMITLSNWLYTGNTEPGLILFPPFQRDTRSFKDVLLSPVSNICFTNSRTPDSYSNGRGTWILKPQKIRLNSHGLPRAHFTYSLCLTVSRDEKTKQLYTEPNTGWIKWLEFAPAKWKHEDIRGTKKHGNYIMY